MPNKALEALKIPEHLSKRKKLTEAQRAAICVHHKAGISQTVLAKHFGVSRGTIRFITNPAAYEIAKQQRRIVPLDTPKCLASTVWLLGW